MRIPSPDSTDEALFFEVGDLILEQLGLNIEALVLGNEPIVETMAQDRMPQPDGSIPLVQFTERLLEQVALPYYEARPDARRPELFVGSINALFAAQKQRDPSVQGLLALARHNTDIAGVDLHLHVGELRHIGDALRVVREQLPTKKIIVTEFSLHRMFRSGLGASGAPGRGLRRAVDARCAPPLQPGACPTLPTGWWLLVRAGTLCTF